MAKEKRYFYECVLACDLGYWGPEHRRENWERKGKAMVQTFAMHNVHMLPEHGMTGRGVPFPADYLVVDQPLGKSYTEVVTKSVSRPATAYGNIGGLKPRIMRPKQSKVKFRQLDANEITAEIRRDAYDYGLPQFNAKGKQISGWDASLFKDNDGDVRLGPEEALNAAAVATDVPVTAEVAV